MYLEETAGFSLPITEAGALQPADEKEGYIETIKK